MKPNKFIRLDEAVKKEIKKLKLTPNESYNEIIKRIVGEFKIRENQRIEFIRKKIKEKKESENERNGGE